MKSVFFCAVCLYFNFYFAFIGKSAREKSSVEAGFFYGGRERNDEVKFLCCFNLQF